VISFLFVALCSSFASTPLFVGSAVAGLDGQVTADLDVPDNVGTFSVRAYAVAQHYPSGANLFGSASSSLSVHKVRQGVSSPSPSPVPRPALSMLALVAVPRLIRGSPWVGRRAKLPVASPTSSEGLSSPTVPCTFLFACCVDR
jgi:hypothetical protein